VSELVELRQSRETFSDLLVESQADERRRVASDVHDSTMQILVAVGLAIGRLRHQQSRESRDSTMTELEGLVSDAQKELRSIAYLAHPPLIREVGFTRALQVLIEGYGRRTGLKVSLQIDSPIDKRWRHTEVVLYRVVQEALANVHRHAKAKRVIVRILVSRRGMLHALIVDDGVGISASARAGVGLQSMRARLKEHGGRLSICRGTPGTIVIASLPGQPHLRSTGDLKVPCP
jgi:signal transduction histidine kinase